MAAPPNWIGSAPNSGGKLWKRLSNTIWARPLRKIEAPIVIMIKATGLAPRAGSIAKRCRANPVAVVTMIAMSAANGTGTPASVRKTVVIPPSMTNSPWAKLMISDDL